MDGYHGSSGALEARGDILATVVGNEAEVDGQVEVDPQDVSLERGAKAHCRLYVTPKILLISK